MELSKNDFIKIRLWIYQNARPIDLARWEYHFENGTKENVLRMLKVYQNEDGGFGHGLEADSLNPFSSPIQTWQATEILNEINFQDSKHEIIQGIINYLSSKKDFYENRWLNTIESNNNYPHAPWWHFNEKTKDDFNPTAALVGFLIKYANPKSEIYSISIKIINELLDIFLKNPDLEMHSIYTFKVMIDYLKSSKEKFKNLNEVKKVLKEKIIVTIKNDEEKWLGYSARPSFFIDSPISEYFYDQQIIDKEIDFMLNTKNHEGLWPPVWGWGNYEQDFIISSMWWKASIAIKYLLFFKAFGKIEK